MGMSMTVTLSELDVLAEFDRRVAKGVIFYDGEPAIQAQELDGYKVGRHSIEQQTFSYAVRHLALTETPSLNLP